MRRTATGSCRRPGGLPPAKGFLKVGPRNVHLSAFRKKTGPGFELRVVENQGQEADASIELGLPLAKAVETDLLGRKIADAPPSRGPKTPEPRLDRFQHGLGHGRVPPVHVSTRLRPKHQRDGEHCKGHSRELSSI